MLKLSLQFFAHKKGVGSTKNGRDSESKRLGVKKADGQAVIAGNIIVRPSEFIADPVAFEDPVEEEESDFIFSNDASYDLNDEFVAAPSAAERDPRQDGMFDFKKLQQEIEDSIEVNKRIKEKDAQRKIRDRDRDRVITEEEKAAPPVKRLSEPLDPDLFFQRPGKDYYASDSMPEIRFDRSKRS